MKLKNNARRRTVMCRVYVVLGMALALLTAPALSDSSLANDTHTSKHTLSHTRPPYCTIKQLDILLTNDDGCNSVGISAMREALLAAGHKVLRIGPAQNSSGGSAAVTFSLKRVDKDSF